MAHPAWSLNGIAIKYGTAITGFGLYPSEPEERNFDLKELSSIDDAGYSN